MKRIFKLAAGVALVAAVSTAGGALAGCSKNNGGDKTGEAYALVHGGSYVGCAKLTRDGDSVKELTLNEVCLPSHVSYSGTSTESADAAKAALDAQYKTDDFVVVSTSKTNNSTGVTTYTATAYYKTVKYGKVTLTYDEAAKAYRANNAVLSDYYQSSNNAKAYFEAVVSNSVKVVVGGEEKAGVMTDGKLNKDKNGYWSNETSVGGSKVEGDYKWITNRNETVKYVKEHGVGKLESLTKNDSGFWTDGTVTTGATWADLNPALQQGATRSYLTYAELILKADSLAK